MSALVLAVLLAAGGDADLAPPFSGLERARRPQRIETIWSALGAPASRAPATGIVALRAPVDGRIAIRGGTFSMGSTPAEMQAGLALAKRDPGFSGHQPEIELMLRAEGVVHQVSLGDFEIDRVEVSVERYKRCVAVGSCAPPSFQPGDARYDRDELPVTHVRWDDARSFCAWSGGGRLPTEAEWEYAARGHTNRAFPWGELWNPRLANHGQIADDPTDGRDGYVGLAPVGSFPDGGTASGILDLAGNVAEWVFDFYERDDAGFGYKGAQVVNPSGPSFSPYGHAVRGGSYRSGAVLLRNAARTAAVDARRDVGFRCVWDKKSQRP